MNDQTPDRPDGDGLLPAPGTILQIGGVSPSNGWGSNAIEVRESTGGVGWRWRAITAVENQWLIDALNSKVAPPTRDGAEGTGDPAFAYTQDCWKRAAAPKPAPDAMRDLITHREAWRSAIEIAIEQADDSRDSMDEKGYWKHELAAFDRTFAAFSSAPVPPADALRQNADRAHDKLYGFVPPADGASAALVVAAEPVAFDPTNHHNALKCPYCNPKGLSFASLPVRGDQEAIARDQIRAVKVTIPQRDFAKASDEYLAGFHNGAKAQLDAILSLPVRPDHKARANAYSLKKWGVKLENLPSDMVDGCYDATFEATDVSRP